MTNVRSIGIAGMSAAQTRLTVAAQRIAGATAAPHREAAQTEPAATPAAAPLQIDAVDLATELLAQRRAIVDFTANLRTVQSDDAMMGTLLDVFG